MDVDGTSGSDFEKVLAEFLIEGEGYDQVRVEVGYIGQDLWCVYVLRASYFQAQFLGKELNGSGVKLATASGVPIGLGDHSQ